MIGIAISEGLENTDRESVELDISAIPYSVILLLAEKQLHFQSEEV